VFCCCWMFCRLDKIKRTVDCRSFFLLVGRLVVVVVGATAATDGKQRAAGWFVAVAGHYRPADGRLCWFWPGSRCHANQLRFEATRTRIGRNVPSSCHSVFWRVGAGRPE
jgi:hypothetical protein